MSEENRIRNLMILDYSQLIMYASSLEELNDINHKEIERLNNIIDELEKWIKENDLGKYRTENVIDTDELLNKLQELKGSDKK